MLPGGWMATAILTVLLVLGAAKAHGRQVRLARERFGVTQVDFRADNGPRVEALWRRDRILLWSVFAVVLFHGIAFAFIDPVADWPPAVSMLVWLPWSLAAAFIGAGLAAWVGQLMPRPDDEAGWRRRAVWASAGWWLLVAAAAALLALSVA